MGRGLRKTMSKRKVIIENDKVREILEKKDILQARMKELVAEGERVQKEGDEIMQKLAREDEKVRPMLEKEFKDIDVGEFEDITTARLILEGKDKGKIAIEITDLLAEFKTFVKEKKNGKDNGSDTKQKITNTGDNA